MPQPKRVPISGWYRTVVGILRPPMMAVTKRDWRGVEHLPKRGGFIAVVNHISYVDPIVFGHFLWDNGIAPRYLAKKSLFTIPVVGRIVEGAGQIPVERESAGAAHAFSAAVEAVKAGECVGVYPEGTITRDPDLWPMVGKTGAARIAFATGAPVIPIAQWGAQDLLAPYAKVPKVVPRPTVHMLAGPPVDLDDLRDKPVTTELLRAATDRIMDRITRQLEVLRGEKAPAVRFDPARAGVAKTGRPDRTAADSPKSDDSGSADPEQP